MARQASDESGFLLLEVLVAFTIAALALALLLAGAAGGLRAASTASRYEQAVARARSHLAAEGGNASVLVPGARSGEDGSGFRWHTQVSSAGAMLLAGPPARRVVLYRVEAAESWEEEGRQRVVRLVSARLQEEASGP